MGTSATTDLARAEGPLRVWLLNLDAEHELEAGPRYTPTARLRAIVARQRTTLFGSLVPPGDLVLDDPAARPARGERLRVLRVTGPGAAQEQLLEPGALAGLPATTWLPTPGALACLARLALVPDSSPPVEVLARVNARPFATEVRRPLLAGAFDKQVVLDLEGARAALARPARLGWLVRRTFGAAGRGRRRIEAERAPDAAELAWLRASLARGPLVVEPWVEVTAELTRSGFVRADGGVAVSGPCWQTTTASGAWTGTERAGAGEVERTDDERLAAATETAGQSLAAAGYRGPFGIDAFRYRDPERPGDPERLNPMSEINARLTMDWSLAMGAEAVPRSGATSSPTPSARPAPKP